MEGCSCEASFCGRSAFMASTIHARTILSASTHCVVERNLATLTIRASHSQANQQRIGHGNFFRNITTLQTPRRGVRGLESVATRAGIKKKVRKAVDDFGLRLLEYEDYTPEQVAIALPLGLAAFEGLYLLSWVANLRGLLPGSDFLFTAAELVVNGIILGNCFFGKLALSNSNIGMINLPPELTRKLKMASLDLMGLAFSLALSFVPFANLFQWLRFASKQRHLPVEAKAALAANAFIYEFPRLLPLLLVLSGGLGVFRQVFLVCHAATLFGSLHRVFEEARIKNERVLMEVARAKKKLASKKPEEISAEERERIDRVKELQDFDLLLAQSSSSNDSTSSGKSTFEHLPLPVTTIPRNVSSANRFSIIACQYQLHVRFNISFQVCELSR
jgi:hypothetical protein